MLKYVAIFCLISGVFSANASVCVDQILKYQGWENRPQDQLDCLFNNAFFSSVTKKFCNKGQTEYSDMFKKYLKFEAQYEAKVAEMSKETMGSSKWSSLAIELHQIDTDWKIFGNKNEVIEVIWSFLRPAADSCLP